MDDEARVNVDIMTKWHRLKELLPIMGIGSDRTANQTRGRNSLKAIQTTTAPVAIGPYSQAIVQGSLLFTSGQLPIDPGTGELRNSDIVTAARQVLSNLRAVLVAGGADMTTVIKTTVFLSDMGSVEAFNSVYAEFFKGTFPARSCIQVAALPRGALVEIEAVAARRK